MMRGNAELQRLESLIDTALNGRRQAANGRLFCSRAGLALINAAFDLFECDALYDLAGDVASGLNLDRAGDHIGHDGEEASRPH